TGCWPAGRPSGSCGSPTRPGPSSRAGWPAPTRCPRPPRSRRRWGAAVRDRLRDILEVRTQRADTIAEMARQRRRRAPLLGGDDQLFIIAADHPARGALRVGDRPMAMADRAELLERLCVALARPGVDGVLGTADIVEDLLLLGALDEEVVVGSMNRGGPAGAGFESGDRF